MPTHGPYTLHPLADLDKAATLPRCNLSSALQSDWYKVQALFTDRSMPCNHGDKATASSVRSTDKSAANRAGLPRSRIFCSVITITVPGASVTRSSRALTALTTGI